MVVNIGNLLFISAETNGVKNLVSRLCAPSECNARHSLDISVDTSDHIDDGWWLPFSDYRLEDYYTVQARLDNEADRQFPAIDEYQDFNNPITQDLPTRGICQQRLSGISYCSVGLCSLSYMVLFSHISRCKHNLLVLQGESSTLKFLFILRMIYLPLA